MKTKIRVELVYPSQLEVGVFANKKNALKAMIRFILKNNMDYCEDDIEYLNPFDFEFAEFDTSVVLNSELLRMSASEFVKTESNEYFGYEEMNEKEKEIIYYLRLY